MAQLTWTAEAERWLRDIYDYIAQDNPAAATRNVEAIYQKAEILREFPESDYRYWQRQDWHIRILLHGHCRIAYMIKNSVSKPNTDFEIRRNRVGL
jgi:toxin ParE1/3/4